MAELVQANLESMLTELEQIKRVELMSADEVREVVRRRQRFEYKMQKRQKNKEDILSYIQYECALLQLIGIRREKIKYYHKKSEIDYAIAKRVHSLYKILEHRFGVFGDIKVWVSHLDFLTGLGWNEEASKVVRTLVQTQSHMPQVWIFAARFEIEKKRTKTEESGNPDFEFLKIENGRRLLLEGLRHHPDSREIYREYFCLELHYVEKLNNRETVDTVEDKRNENIDGNIAKIVLKQALQVIPDDPSFESELLALVFHFPIAKVRTRLLDYYLQLKGETPEAWDRVARLQLLNRHTDDGRNAVDKIEQCVEIYEKSVKTISTAEMFDMYLTTLLELVNKFANGDDERAFFVEKLLNAFDTGRNLKVLSDSHKKMFSQFLQTEMPAAGDSSSDES